MIRHRDGLSAVPPYLPNFNKLGHFMLFAPGRHSLLLFIQLPPTWTRLKIIM